MKFEKQGLYYSGGTPYRVVDIYFDKCPNSEDQKVIVIESKRFNKATTRQVLNNEIDGEWVRLSPELGDFLRAIDTEE